MLLCMMECGIELYSSVLCTSRLYAISDSEHYKSQALRNAKEAYQIHQERVSWSMRSIRSALIPYKDTHTHTDTLPWPSIPCSNPQISPCRRGCLMRRQRTAAVHRYTQLAAHPRPPALGLERATAFPTHPSMQAKTFRSPQSSTANSRVTNSRAWTGWPTFMNRYPRPTVTLETHLGLQAAS